MLRREETTWRREFVLRYNLRRRWERSRNTTITHVPHPSAVNSMHLMPNTTLLAASLQYGIVSRSYPLTGKVLRGFLDASGTTNGLGIGNPNVEFSPHVTVIALASEGGTAKVLWGFRNGEVAVTTANRAMDRDRSCAAKQMRCNVLDSHEGMVCDVAWGMGPDGPMLFVTGAMDGHVKLWDAKQVRCLWTSDREMQVRVDPCIKVAIDIAHATVVGAMQSGDFVVWFGFDDILPDHPEPRRQTPRKIKISAPPFSSTAPSPYGGNSIVEHNLMELHVMFVSAQEMALLVVYEHDPLFYRIGVHLGSSEVTYTPFGDGAGGPIHSLKPVFASQASETSFILTGDQLGCISVFAWDARPATGATNIMSVQTFDAHGDGAVTALAWNPIVLVSGSARGTVKVWDALTFAPLRAFASPAARPAVGGEWDGATEIMLEKDAVVVSVGNKIMAWKAGPVGQNEKGKGKQTRASKNSGVAKWHHQLEMYRDVMESRRELEEEKAYSSRIIGREKEQRSTLENLGLNEVEAVEYVLMVSRDEEERRRRAGSQSLPVREDEGIFMADFDDVQTPMVNHAASITPEPSSPVSSRAPSLSTDSHPDGSVSYNSPPRVMPSARNHKVQVSPRARPEPMEAGLSASPHSGSLSSSTGIHSPPTTSDAEQFPAVSRTPSSAGRSAPHTPASWTTALRSVSGSPKSTRSAWSKPLRSARSSSDAAPAHGSGASPPPLTPRRLTPPGRPAVSGPSLLFAGFAQQRGENAGAASLSGTLEEDENGEDADLRYAIELSLAEARSRGESV
ncbi:hypothetical protein B0H21DRAFT_758368 [Amylocystis lapponica]|nr:hypothetical protein B0H21DRAFT_758368 [Amylocystis lapponica]